MARKRRKHRSKIGTPTSQLTKEMVIQAYALCGNKAQVAREIDISWPTVHKIIQEAETDKSLQKARRTALEDVAGKVHAKAVEVIDSIGESDIESGLIKTYDEDGKLVQVKAYGPSLLQKTTSAAILVDKLGVIEQTKRALLEDHGNGVGQLPMPDNIQDALKVIGEKVARFRMIDVQFRDKQPELATKLADVQAAMREDDQIEDADYVDLDAFDNPT